MTDPKVVSLTAKKGASDEDHMDAACTNHVINTLEVMIEQAKKGGMTHLLLTYIEDDDFKWRWAGHTDNPYKFNWDTMNHAMVSYMEDFIGETYTEEEGDE